MRRLVVLALILVALFAFATIPSVLNLGESAIGLWFLVAWVTVPAFAGLACLHTAANSAGADRRAWRSFGLGCLIGANALVTEGMEIPDGSLVLGSPARLKSQLSAEQQLILMHNADHYVRNAQRYNALLEVQE